MGYEFKLPDLGEGLTEGEIARWLVTEGQELAEDDPLVEIQTDKTTVEIPSPAAGTVTKILVGEGEIVPVGTVLVVIGGEVAEPATAAPAPQAAASQPVEEVRVESTQGRVQATPIVRRIAQELGVDLAQLSGTGPNGRITEQDVRAAAGDELVLNQHKRSEGRREPVRGVRRQIVEHLTRAHREVPAVTFVEECDFTDGRRHSARLARAEGDRGVAKGVPGAERAPRRRRDRLSRALRHRRRGADRPGTRRTRRAGLRLPRRATSSRQRSHGSPTRRVRER